MYFRVVKSVIQEVRPLFLPQLVRLTTMLRPGLKQINVSMACTKNELKKFPLKGN